ncbi:hypothetical protein SAMN05660826_02029 [Caldanaerovirga acetigignens]|uniref:Uncharacterized protein n=1 Tax=Caldanaerovirga acetigignens TaxID=447595 RepID=A0A1M7LTD3_9FIRM|nr:hypothetical protein [Caldanaerovirga acetigignens]SHM81489.1 hypothetical protein SAMN05660826_02029 [Caldanaerovirga acetigignens]
MDRTVKEMSSEELEKYKKGLREKLFKEKEALEERYKRAWEVAEKAAVYFR